MLTFPDIKQQWQHYEQFTNKCKSKYNSYKSFVSKFKFKFRHN